MGETTNDEAKGTLITPAQPKCDGCGGDEIQWVAWSLDENGCMKDLGILCHACKQRFKQHTGRERFGDHEVIEHLGFKRAFFLLEDMMRNYTPPMPLALRLVQFSAWAARQPPSSKSTMWTVVGGDPNAT